MTAPVPECDLVAHGVVAGEARGWLLLDDGRFTPDRAAGGVLTRTELVALLDDPGDRLTFTCVPWGSGVRVALDRNEDGILNGDEP